MSEKEFLQQYEHKEVVERENQVTEEPLVSVLVQTYKHENYIRMCLDSIVSQETNFPFEIILAEDESPDGTRKICEEYAARHPKLIRFFLHHRENNIKINGSATGRFVKFHSLFNARGKYIAFCDGDDYWTDATKLQRQVSAMEKNPDINICGHPSSKLNDKNNTIIGTAGFHGSSKKIISPEEIIARKGTIVPMQSIMIRQLQFGDLFKLAIDTIGLHGILIIYASIPYGCLYLPDTMAVYRVNSLFSITANQILTEQNYLTNIIGRIDLLKKLDVFYNKEYTIYFYENIDQLYNSILRSPYTSFGAKYKYFKWNRHSMKNLLIGIIKRIKKNKRTSLV